MWQRCLDLGISPSFHASGRGVGFGLRAAPSNFTCNHIGHFAAAGEAVCKALFFGGVTHRFPRLRFAFLEGGVAWAFRSDNLPFGTRLKATLGSDIGHFDVSDMAHVIPEAWELVEDGLMSPADFRDFSFANVVRFFGGGNPSFFAGTSVETAAAELLAAEH